MDYFDELKASLEEAVEIKDGNKAPARATRYEVADVKAIRTQQCFAGGDGKSAGYQRGYYQKLGVQAAQPDRPGSKSTGGYPGQPGVLS